jgi:asparagine synthetase B (glutamine-hydrolysing)
VYSGAGADEIFCGYQHTLRHYGKDNRHEMQRDFVSNHHKLDLRAYNKVFMLNAIECRSPFLSPSIVEYASRLDVSACLVGERRQMKLALRNAYRDVLGDARADAPKLIARETMGVKQKLAERHGKSPYVYRERFKALFDDKALLLDAIARAKSL